MKKNQSIIKNQVNTITDPAELGQIMNAAATQNIFSDYLSRKSQNTKNRHARELTAFGTFLLSLGFSNQGMKTPDQWHGVTFGMIEGYKNQLLKSGYSISTIDQTLSIIKAYARLAAQAGYIPAGDMLLISGIRGYKSAEERHIDQTRTAQHISTRREQSKKASNTIITRYQAEQLKHGQANTLQGKRDSFLISLLLDHGARISEVISLTGSSFDMKQNTVTFFREKVNRYDTHRLSEDTKAAAASYFAALKAEGIHLDKNKSIWIGINKGGKISGGFSKRAAQQTVTAMGNEIKLIPLSPHDCRHYFATAAHKGGTDSLDIMRAGGWNTMTMVNRYVDRDEISNINIKLG